MRAGAAGREGRGGTGRLHLDGSLGAEVGLVHVLETLGGVDGHVQRLRLVEHLGVRVQHAERHGCCLASLAPPGDLASGGGEVALVLGTTRPGQEGGGAERSGSSRVLGECGLGSGEFF